MAGNVNKISWSTQPCQLVKNNRRFSDRLRLHRHVLMMETDRAPETSAILNQLTVLVAWKDFTLSYNSPHVHSRTQNSHHFTLQNRGS